MTAYKYKALSRDGSKVSGVVEAYDEFEAVAKIKADCSVVLKITPVAEKRRERIDLNEPMWVSDKVLSLTASQFAILLKAGMPTARTVEIIAQQTTDKLMKRILTEVAKDVAAGYSLSQSLETRGKKIPLTFIETVRAGEESGTLEESFARLVTYYEKSHKIRSKVRSAMMYPIFLSVLAVAVIIIIVKVTVPVVTSMIVGNGGKLPLPTRMLLGAYNFFGKWWWAFIGVIVAAVICIILYRKTENGRLRFAKLSMKLPVLGKISVLKSASQFAGTMATLLSAGLPITNALTITGKVLDNYAVGLTVGACTLGIEEGKRLGDVLRTNPYLPPLLTEMTAVGEESDALEGTLTTIGTYFDSEVEQASAKALSMLEPMITVVMGVVIGFIVIALYLPMFTMYSSIGA